MTNVWHESVIYFGYEICLPDNISSNEFHTHSTLLYSLNDLLPKPFTICSILNRYCNSGDNYFEHLDNLAIIVLGVSVNLNDYSEVDDIQSMKEDCIMGIRGSVLEKTKYPEINEVLDKYDIMEFAKFYNGIEWRGSQYYELYNESDNESEVDSNDGCSRWEDYENDESDVETDENSDEDSDEYDEEDEDSDEYDDEYDDDDDDKEAKDNEKESA